MVIVDSQVHLWATNPKERLEESKHTGVAWQGLPEFSMERLTREMGEAGVDRAVIVTPSWEPNNNLGLTAARLYPERFAVMGSFNVEAPNAREQIRTWLSQQGMLGLRFTYRFKGGSDDWVWEAAENAGTPIMLSPSALRPRHLSQIAQRHPRLKFVLDHMCLPRRTRDEEAFKNFDEILALAKHPNIALKASGLMHYTADAYPYRALHKHLRQAFDAFGPKRIFWGTDITEQPCTYRQAVTMYTEEIPWLSSQDKEWIMGRGVAEWLGWKL